MADHLPARAAVRRGLLPARGARAAALGHRVQPRLHVHRPPAAGQVADRGRRAAVRLRLAGLAVRLGDRRHASPSSSSPGWPAGSPAPRCSGWSPGLLLALDGFSFVISRLGPARRLPAGRSWSARVACLVVDRDRVRARVRAAGAGVPATGFRLGPRGWRIAAGFLFGCACAVKWSGIYFLAFFAVLSLFWDRAAWREAGVPRPDPDGAAPRAARRRLGAGRGPGAHLPGLVHRLVPLARPARAGTGPSSTRTPRSRSSRARCARCGTCTPSGCTFHDHLTTPHPWQSGPVVVAGRRPADPAVEPAAPDERRRHAGGPLHPDGRDADPLAAVRAGAALGALAGGRPPRPRRGARRGGRDRRGLADLVHQPRADDVHLLHGPGRAVLRPGHHPGAAGRARPTGRLTPRGGRSGSAWWRCTSRSSPARSSSSTRCSPGSRSPIARLVLRGSGSPPGSRRTPVPPTLAARGGPCRRPRDMHSWALQLTV